MNRCSRKSFLCEVGKAGGFIPDWLAGIGDNRLYETYNDYLIEK